jgi:hypothetical protein
VTCKAALKAAHLTTGYGRKTIAIDHQDMKCDRLFFFV